MSGVTLEARVHFGRGRRSRKELRAGEDRIEVPEGHIPRVSRLMALAIRFEQLVREGAVSDYAELSRLGQVTRARMSQIVGLLNLAASLQEELLFLPRVQRGRDPVTERDLRKLVAEPDWARQLREWKLLMTQSASSGT